MSEYDVMKRRTKFERVSTNQDTESNRDVCGKKTDAFTLSFRDARQMTARERKLIENFMVLLF